MNRVLELLRDGIAWFKRFWTTSRFGRAEGVHRFDIRFFMVAVCYLLSVWLMQRDSWFAPGDLTFANGMVAVLIAIIFISGVCFEWKWLGPPKGPNLGLQLTLMIPVALVFGRAFGTPYNWTPARSLVGFARDAILGAIDKIAGIASDSVFGLFVEVLRQPVLAVVLVGLMISFAVRKRANRIALLSLVLGLPVLIAYAKSPPEPVFLLGVGVMIVGVSLQAMDYGRYSRDYEILSRLRHVDDEVERRVTLRLVRRALDTPGGLAEETVRETVRRCYVDQASLAGVNELSNLVRAISNRLVNEYGLLEAHQSRQGGFRLIPAADLREAESRTGSPFSRIRSAVFIIVAVVWCVSPIDLIPDATPLFGVMDDLAVALAVAASVRGQMRTNNANSRED